MVAASSIPFTDAPLVPLGASDVQAAIDAIKEQGITPFEAAIFGSGVDGNVTVNSAVNLARDMYYNHLTLTTTSCFLTTLGYITSALILEFDSGANAVAAGALRRANPTSIVGGQGGNGSGGIGGTAAAALAAGSVGGGSIGGTRTANSGDGSSTGGGIGQNGQSVTAVAGAYYAGGRGGDGGFGGNLTRRGSGGTGAAIALSFYPVELKPNFLRRLSMIYGGSGGGQGGGGGGNGATGEGCGGGAGGGGSGVMPIFAKRLIVGAGTPASCITAIGGVGGAGGTTSNNNCNGGAGGGGGGGFIFLVVGSSTGSVSAGINASGGAGGTGGGGSLGASTDNGYGGNGGYGGRIIYYHFVNGLTYDLGPHAGSSGSAPVGSAGGVGGAGGITTLTL